MYHVLNCLAPLGGWSFGRGIYKKYTKRFPNSLKFPKFQID